jgi:hypothetical protein
MSGTASRGHDALLDEQRRQRAQPALVIRRGQVVRRVHPLDRMPQLVKLGDPLQRRDRQPEHPALPALMEDRLVALDRDCAEPVETAEVMDAVYALDLTSRRSLPPHRATRRPRHPRAPFCGLMNASMSR